MANSPPVINAATTVIRPDVINVPTQVISGQPLNEAPQYDPLSQLLAFQWMDTEVPVTKTRMSLAHDLVEHKYWGVNGARVENTGMAPMRIHATIPIQNGMTNGLTEAWDEQDPYPNLLRSLIISFSRRTTGVLVHPEFGELACKAEKLEIDWDAMRRGGCDVEASWVETAQDNDVAFTDFPSPVVDTGDSARRMEAEDTNIRALVPLAPQYEASWEDMFDDVAAVFNQTTLSLSQVEAPVDRLVARAHKVADAAERTRSALTWVIADLTQKIIASAPRVRAQLVEQGRSVSIFTVPGDTTLAAVMLRIPGARLADVIRLNPRVMHRPLIKRFTAIRYFATP